MIQPEEDTDTSRVQEHCHVLIAWDIQIAVNKVLEKIDKVFEFVFSNPCLIESSNCQFTPVKEVRDSETVAFKYVSLRRIKQAAF